MRYYRLAENAFTEGTWVEVETADVVEDAALREALEIQAAAEAIGKTAVHVTARVGDTHLLTYNIPRGPLTLPPDRE